MSFIHCQELLKICKHHIVKRVTERGSEGDKGKGSEGERGGNREGEKERKRGGRRWERGKERERGRGWCRKEYVCV